MITSLAATLAFAGFHANVYAEAPESAQNTAIEHEMNKEETNEEAVTLFVGDKPLCLLKSEADYEALVQKLQNHFKSEGSQLVGMTIEPELSVKTEPYEGEIQTVDSAFKLLAEGGKQEAVYVAEETESLESIAKKFNMTLDEIKAINPNWEDPVTKGSKINILKSAPMIRVSTEEVVKSVQNLPYATTVKKDANRLKTERIVERKGVEGQVETTMRVQKQDGQVVSSVAEGSRLSREAVPEIVVVGTKEGYATGTFKNPTIGRLTSPFGPRWGRFHYGIDVANGVGTDIKAADGGVVTKAGPAGTYGNLVIIDHQNGYTTRYAHLSRIDVRVGQTVKQGESVAKMGSTGRSTGSHLHFEVRVNGKAQNPLNYVKY
ncbi:MAG: peptidoglycan DD-metalloendopeptidase family protein [Peptoniphilus sp.]|nr:peptidoglycan DD-metalloendopeptidase family protein [Peptoniphilus sp.]MDD7363504.1 peptidoglycan DD-metalloendopeptidase family protein [Bacillota bacterium]MDY6044792.1 peptidoglycan DD-metalloendopeptidase family protein [Peptoniphilus sp.]